MTCYGPTRSLAGDADEFVVDAAFLEALLGGGDLALIEKRANTYAMTRGTVTVFSHNNECL